MLNEYFSIGETSKLSNISIDRLRNYDKINLIKPTYIDKKNGYRYYSKDQFRTLRIINYLRKIDLPLAEIKLLFDNQPNSKEYLNLLNKRILTIEEEITTLKLVKEDITQLRNNMEYNLKHINENNIIFKEIEERCVIQKSTNESFDFALNHREYFLANLRKKIPILKAGSILEKGFYSNNLYNWKNSLSNIYIYTSFNKNFNFIIPKGTYLCISYKNNEQEIAFLKAIDYIKENNIKITGFFVNVVLPIIPKEKFQLQILIEK